MPPMFNKLSRITLPRLRSPHAFTLIELLIVIAIIAILAAIAVPNFLEAQARAKVARARNDMRTICTALESYRLDINAYPSMIESGFAGGVAPLAGSELKWWYVPNALSTPIAYIASADMRCPFGGNWDKAPYFPDNIWRRYGYENIQEMINKAADFPLLKNRYSANAIDLSGPWRLESVGPDKLWNPSISYDPTNGTISGGDMMRTQLSPEGNR